MEKSWKLNLKQHVNPYKDKRVKRWALGKKGVDSITVTRGEWISFCLIGNCCKSLMLLGEPQYSNVSFQYDL